MRRKPGRCKTFETNDNGVRTFDCSASRVVCCFQQLDLSYFRHGSVPFEALAERRLRETLCVRRSERTMEIFPRPSCCRNNGIGRFEVRLLVSSNCNKTISSTIKTSCCNELTTVSLDTTHSLVIFVIVAALPPAAAVAAAATEGPEQIELPVAQIPWIPPRRPRRPRPRPRRPSRDTRRCPETTRKLLHGVGKCLLFSPASGRGRGRGRDREGEGRAKV